MSTRSRLTVVLVDDSDDLRLLVRTRLRLAGGFEIVGEGKTGHDAVALAGDLRPDLLLLDISMPDMDGFEALAALRVAAPATRVVVFSGFDEPDLERRARALGAADFVAKSLPVEELPARLLSAGGAAQDGDGDAPAPEVAQQADHIHLLFQQADTGMATVTLAGRLIRTNRAFADLLGTSSEDLVGLELRDVVDDDHRPDVESATRKVAGGTSSVSVEHGLARDRAIWLSTTLTLVRDREGAPLYLFLQTQDIREQRQTARALQQSEERFRLLVETVRDYAIFMLDPTGRITSWNAGAERIKGFSASDVLGRHFRMFYLPEAQQARHPEHELEVAATSGRYEEEGWRVRKDGTTFWASVTITALRDDVGRLVGFAKVTRDVTERERLALARRQAEHAGHLLSVIAHELRNPVGVMTGAARTLSEYGDKLLAQEQTELLAALSGSGARVRRLLDDLLTASRLDASALEVRPVEVTVLPLLVDALRLVDIADEGHIRVAVSPPAAEPAVLADPHRLQQMITNLVTNALRHGGPPVAIEVSADDTSVHIDVIDHGPGVPDDIADRMFERFVTGNPSRGTGLGLFIVCELARAQGGSLHYTRVDGRSVFRVSLPSCARLP